MSLTSEHRRALNYALLAVTTHLLCIAASLVPGWRAAPLLGGDAVTYLTPAQTIVSHGAFSLESGPPYLWEPYRTPGYPLLIAATIATMGDFRWTLFLAAASAGLAAWCAVRLTAMWGGNPLAQHTAGILLACLPNSLGLSAMLLTDAVFGHLALVLIYLVWVGLTRLSWPLLTLSVASLWFMQTLKPTFNVAALLVIWIGYWVHAVKWTWRLIAVLALLTTLWPAYFAWRMWQDHSVFAPTLLGTQTAREYLQARYVAEITGQDYSVVTDQIHAQDLTAAAKLSTPSSSYGRLYLVQQVEVDQFFREHTLAALRLMFTEALQQFAAPQEFAFVLFWGDLPWWGRALGSTLTLAIWASAGLGAWHVGRSGDWRPGLTLMGILIFFLAAGSVSHLVGARLRFPADLVAIPLAALGITEPVAFP